MFEMYNQPLYKNNQKTKLNHNNSDDQFDDLY